MAIASASEDEIHRLTHSWVYGSSDTYPFLLINRGAATLSGSDFGAAILRDAITQREIQLLDHTGICGSYFSVALTDVHVSHHRSPCLCDGMSWFHSRM